MGEMKASRSVECVEKVNDVSSGNTPHAPPHCSQRIYFRWAVQWKKDIVIEGAAHGIDETSRNAEC